jgi:2-polyprenyl-3-methyl-5-hydroxy-6-metoxy-1,4-benzoquinol methylase
MINTQNTFVFLAELVTEIEKKDKLHSKKINRNISYLKEHFPTQLDEILGLVKAYFKNIGFDSERVASDYLKMIRDMRNEGLYFYKNGKYRCDNQHIANEYVYSKPEVMSYYMNALLVSQVMWKHHFNIFMFFQSYLETLFIGQSKLSILDVGPGHGFFSYLVKKEFPDYEKIDIVDISETSLEMTKNIIGYDGDKIKYINKDIFYFEESNKYDFVVLGEVLEHLDEPKQILIKLSKLLKPGGLLWLTTPTNSPALDHVYLFNNKEDVLELVFNSGLKTVDVCNYFAEDVDEQTALKNKITNLVGLFCKNKFI